MAGEVEELKSLITNSDFSQYMENDALLSHAVEYAIAMINQRRCYEPLKDSEPEYEPRYRINVIEGALWWLAKQGAEGYSNLSENGVSITWASIPNWLKNIRPRIQTWS